MLLHNRIIIFQLQKLTLINRKDKMKFKDRFNEALKMTHKLQSEIAVEAGVSRQCISDYKSGKTVPSIETLYFLCKSLDVSADYLLGLSEEL